MMLENDQKMDFGPVVLFGSGETSPSGQKIFDTLFQELPKSPKVSLLETPAGFELNSAQVINRVAKFLQHRLQNYQPQIETVPARQRGTPFSPDDVQIAAPLLKSDLIFAGPGSPTYTVRQLEDSITWHYLVARHRFGAALAFSSAAVIALSQHTLPVYEIFKVGEDPHWKPGLNFFAPFGLSLVFIPHWNNNDGGDELDTSRCFIGKARFEPLLETLPKDQIVIGIDEHTALWVDCVGQRCRVMGSGTVTIIKNGDYQIIPNRESFLLDELMDCELPDPKKGIPSEVWEAALLANQKKNDRVSEIPAEVLALVDQRQAAREHQDWRAADELRDQVTALGWMVTDTPEGPEINRIK